MRHDIVVEGYGFRLRPIQDQDAPFILSLRQDSELGRHLHPTPGGVEGQVAWLQNYYARPGDYYFVIERRTCRTPEGVISIYDIHSGGASGEWGRWILKKGVSRGRGECMDDLQVRPRCSRALGCVLSDAGRQCQRGFLP